MTLWIKMVFRYFSPLVPIAAACVILAVPGASGADRIAAASLFVSGLLASAVVFVLAVRESRELSAELANKENQAWIKSKVSEMTILLHGATGLEKSARLFLDAVVPMISATYGSLYLKKPGHLQLLASYAVRGLEPTIADGEGLLGQCAVDGRPIEVTPVPAGYVSIRSSLGQSEPAYLLVLPILHERNVVAVIELAALQPLSERSRQLLGELGSNLGIVLNTVLDRAEIGKLAVETLQQKAALEEQTKDLQAKTEELQTQTEELQMQAEELITQQESLRALNEELEEQTDRLRESERERRNQQRELEDQYSQLEQKAEELAALVRLSEEQKEVLQKQAVRLELSSRYKTEFLANMSHELRTPLNSMLILSQTLVENKTGNLTDKQIEFAATILASGRDLLHLIDDLLDLSKVEAGKMSVDPEYVRLSDVLGGMRRTFEPLAQKKGLVFSVEQSGALPDGFVTDSQRLQQILKNLLSNAIKFTERGSVSLLVEPAGGGERDGTVAFIVRDTGIGISEDKMEIIFEAFQQADGSMSRKYGGTGLGLTISRELALLLGGEIAIDSHAGAGSTFTLYLPIRTEPAQLISIDQVAAGTDGGAPARSSAAADREAALPPLLLDDSQLYIGETAFQPTMAPIEDDRESLAAGDQVILIIEDDAAFARTLLYMARDQGFKAIVALDGRQGLTLAKDRLPSAIILDIQLPGLDGWSILSHLKNQPETRHIPVHIASVVDEPQLSISLGALAYLRKPFEKDQLDMMFRRIESAVGGGKKRLLIVEDSEALWTSLTELIRRQDVVVTAVSSAEEALEQLRERQFDCMVLDLGLAEMTGLELLETIGREEKLAHLPIIIYTGKELGMDEETNLKRYVESIIVKNVKSEERLLDEVALFLHRPQDSLPAEKRMMLQKMHDPAFAFEGRQILLVDDDIRNVFALSTILESYKIDISIAQNGVEALEILDRNPDIHLVLMDIMMPEMDGYEAIRRIRAIPRFERLPIIALTAKAMKEDRMKCLQAGASDYISKPVFSDQLFSLLKVWLFR